MEPILHRTGPQSRVRHSPLLTLSTWGLPLWPPARSWGESSVVPRPGASWQLAHELEVWTWPSVPREQFGVWHFRSSCRLNCGFSGQLCGRVRLLPRFLGKKSLSGCRARVWVLPGGRSPGQGGERRLLLLSQPDPPHDLPKPGV